MIYYYESHAIKINAAQARMLRCRRRSATLVILTDTGATEAHTIQMHGTAWSEGSQNSYYLLDVDSRAIRHVPCERNPVQFGGSPHQSVTVEPYTVLIECGTFRGKSGFPTVWGTASDLATIGLGQNMGNAPCACGAPLCHYFTGVTVCDSCADSTVGA
jgi:hypothetical protein